jgi:hypothetical protein
VRSKYRLSSLAVGLLVVAVALPATAAAATGGITMVRRSAADGAAAPQVAATGGVTSGSAALAPRRPVGKPGPIPAPGTKLVPAGHGSATHRGTTKPAPAPVTKAMSPPQVSAPTGAAAPQVLAANFPGATQAGNAAAGNPPDPNVAVGDTQIVEVTNNVMSVFTKAGGLVCNSLLTDILPTAPGQLVSDPRVIYDNVNKHFVISDMLLNPTPTDQVTMFVGNTISDNACGPFNRQYVTLGTANPKLALGNILDQPAIAEDQDGILFSGFSTPPNGAGPHGFFVFAIPKVEVYGTASFGFDVFETSVYAAPVGNAGIPMISNGGTGFFLGFAPGTGYMLWQVTGEDTIHPVVLFRRAYSAPFVEAPNANQPGTPVLVDTLMGVMGRITSPPVFDGALIWFVHHVNRKGYPILRYGALDPGSSNIATNFAYHSATSDDFNASLAVGLGTGIAPTKTIFLNWSFTDVFGGWAITNAVATATVPFATPLGSAVKPIIATDTPVRSGGNGKATTAGEPARFGDYSSVAIDPTVPGGTCAVSVNEYFAASGNGNWLTRIARFGTC